MDSTLLTDICKSLKEQKMCMFYVNKNENYEEYNDLEDIEDLFKSAKSKKFCPYYFNLEKSKLYANLTFLSYNYILNPFIRKTLSGIIKHNSIIILDEAHNINNIFDGLFTKKIDLKDIEETQESLQLVLDIISLSDIRNDTNFIIDISYKVINNQINVIKKFIKNVKSLKNEINSKYQKIEESDKLNCYISNSSFFKNIFKDFPFGFYGKITEIINKLITKEEEKLEEYYEKNNFNNPLKTILKKPKKIYEFFFQLKDIIEKEEKISFKFIIHSPKNDPSDLNIIFEIYCIDSSFGMKSLQKISPYSIILTSGTLAINSLENSLGIKFKETLKNDHVIKKERFLAHIIKSVKINNNIYDFDFSYKNRMNEELIIRLGNEIYNLIKSVTFGGILVFFSSYDYLQTCYKIWSNNYITEKFYTLKKPIFDLFSIKEQNEFLIEEVKKENNLLLFTVHRGINSEGINFPDDQARMVICIGISFPNIRDLKVKLKMDYLNEKYGKKKDGKKGWNWYKGEASVAINQSLGRLLRNVNDYGLMICFGKEFKTNKNMLSKWIQNNVSYIDLDENKDNYYKQIEDFLTNMKNKENKNEIIGKEEENILNNQIMNKLENILIVKKDENNNLMNLENKNLMNKELNNQIGKRNEESNDLIEFINDLIKEDEKEKNKEKIKFI